MIKNILLIFLPLSLWATDINLCKHLLNRTSFSFNSTQLSLCIKQKNYKNSVELLLSKNRVKPPLNNVCKEDIIIPYKKKSTLNAIERKAFRTKKKNSHKAFKEYWVKRILNSHQLLIEKMMMFWHNHLTSSLVKVGQASLLCKQNKLFEQYALGNFRNLLHEIIEDPAMLIYLDNSDNKKIHPNENFAREFLELFTLGEGEYHENDIKNFAQSLTGYSIGKDFSFRFKKSFHDKSIKTFLGQEGQFNAHNIIDIILKQEATAIFIVKKLWLTFINNRPNPIEVKKLAKLFRDNHYEIKPLLRAIFLSSHFTTPQNRASMIKSPLELLIGTFRLFNYHTFNTKQTIRYLKRLEQDLFDPPNVKGWEGGENWINTSTLLIRRQFLHRFIHNIPIELLDNNMLFSIRYPQQTKEERVIEVLLPLTLKINPKTNFRNTLRSILTHPLYQLK